MSLRQAWYRALPHGILIVLLTGSSSQTNLESDLATGWVDRTILTAKFGETELATNKIMEETSGPKAV
jgi:hypothetical protein